MSVLIKGLNMPKDDCEAYQEIIITNNYVGNGKIQMLAHDSNTNEFIGEVVEVPTPHGRLIDAEALSSQFHKDTGRLHLITTHGFVSECIEDAPTVIEAEEQEHDCGKSEEEKE